MDSCVPFGTCLVACCMVVFPFFVFVSVCVCVCVCCLCSFLSSGLPVGLLIVCWPSCFSCSLWCESGGQSEVVTLAVLQERSVLIA